jgi:hypothetical protein
MAFNIGTLPKVSFKIQTRGMFIAENIKWHDDQLFHNLLLLEPSNG